jgi:hypothetical protein
MIHKYLIMRSPDGQENGGGVKALLIGEATAEQIQEWKEKYKGGVYALVVDGHIGYFKNPDRREMNAAMSKASSEAALDMFEDLAGTTFIGGSRAVLTDDDKFFGITQQLKTKMDGKKAILKNL